MNSWSFLDIVSYYFGYPDDSLFCIVSNLQLFPSDFSPSDSNVNKLMASC
jgi:hypothetical protein